MRKAKEYKALAREALKGNYGVAIGAAVLPTVLSFLLMLGGVMLLGIGALGMYGAGEINGFGVAVMSGSVIGFLCCVIASLFLGYMLALGLTKLYLTICRGKKAYVSELFYGFRKGSHPFRYLGASLLIFLIVYAVMLLLFLIGVAVEAAVWMDGISIPFLLVGALLGLYFNFSLAMAPVLLIDHPGMKIREAFKLSRRMMKGRKLKFFWLSAVSFIFWQIPAAMTFGLALLWIAPYYSCTLLMFYLDAAGEPVDRYASVNDAEHAYAKGNGAEYREAGSEPVGAASVSPTAEAAPAVLETTAAQKTSAAVPASKPEAVQEEAQQEVQKTAAEESGLETASSTAEKAVAAETEVSKDSSMEEPVVQEAAEPVQADMEAPAEPEKPQEE